MASASPRLYGGAPTLSPGRAWRASGPLGLLLCLTLTQGPGAGCEGPCLEGCLQGWPSSQAFGDLGTSVSKCPQGRL